MLDGAKHDLIKLVRKGEKLVMIDLDNKRNLVCVSSSDVAQHAECRCNSIASTLNGQLNRWETIKKWKILPNDLSIESGELTPSLKVKRKVVEDNYRDILDGFYAGS